MPSDLDEFLAARSSLTRKQIERLTLHISLQRGGVSVSQGESAPKMSGVTPGAYYRVLSQARQNVNQALYTVLLSSRMGVLQMDDLRRLLDMMAKAPSEVSEQDAAQLKALVDALVTRIVML
jgi:hypothetical protein